MTQESTVDDMDTDGEARPKNIDDGADDQRSPGGGGGAISVSDDKANTAKDGGFMQETNPSSTRIGTSETGESFHHRRNFFFLYPFLSQMICIIRSVTMSLRAWNSPMALGW